MQGLANQIARMRTRSRGRLLLMVVVAFALLCSPATFAIQFSGEASSRGGYYLNPSAANQVTNGKNINRFLSNDGFGLANLWLGQFDIHAHQILATLAPQYKDCEVRLGKHRSWKHDVHHERYRLFCSGIEVDRAYINLHFRNNRLVMLQHQIPEAVRNHRSVSWNDFNSVKSLGIVPPEGTKYSYERRVLANSGGFLVPCWRIDFVQDSGAKISVLVDAGTGAVLQEEDTWFPIADVYLSNPESAIAAVELPDLLDTGYLDGKTFSIYAPELSSPRVSSSEGVFNVDPWSTPIEFDQVQAYYFATEVQRKFALKFDHQLSEKMIVVKTNSLPNGIADNAIYIPEPEGPLVMIGQGGGSLTNLARDIDVMTHELSHHVIYEHLRSSHRESGYLHEGIADYFAYVLNGDPYLAETTSTRSNWLRSGAEPQFKRFDDPELPEDRYLKGELWSAFLWDARAEIGDPFDQIVFHSLPYLQRASGFQDALIGLFQADRDLSDSGDTAFGVYKCAIMNAAVVRGLATWMEDIDGDDCGFNMATLAEESRRLMDPPPETFDGPEFSFTVGGKTCSTIGPGRVTGPFGILLLVIPLLLFLRNGSSRRRPDHES